MKKQLLSIVAVPLLIAMLFTTGCSSGQKDAASCAGGAVIAIALAIFTGGDGILPAAGGAVSACIPFGSDVIDSLTSPQGTTVNVVHDKNKPTLVQTQTFNFQTAFFDTRKVGTCGGRTDYNPPNDWQANITFSMNVGNDSYTSQNFPGSGDTSNDADIAHNLVNQFHLDFNQPITTVLHMPALPPNTEAQSIAATFDVTFQVGSASVNGGQKVAWAFPLSAAQQSGNAQVKTVPCGSGPPPTLTGPYPDTSYTSAHAGCNDKGGAEWLDAGGASSCTSSGMQLSQAANSQYSAGEEFELNGLLPQDFRVIVSASKFLAPHTCAGVGLLVSDIQEYDALACQDGSWEVKTGNDNTGALTKLSGGKIPVSQTYELNVSVQQAKLRVSVNGIYLTSVSLGKSYVGPYALYLDVDENPNGSTNQYPASAVFSSFSYAPLD